MDQTTIASVALPGSAGAHSLSVIALFLQADWVVKTVIIMLFLASVWCACIVVGKWIFLRRKFLAADRFEDTFWSGVSLSELYERAGKRPSDPMTAIFAAAMREWRRSVDRGAGGGADRGLQTRIDRVMQVTLAREIQRMEKNMTFLASVGSTAPFIGLFGTVWGIMNSFQSIAVSKNTSLAVVAPGIAEALFATALGLVAAIPAVIAYNKLSTELGRYTNRLEAFAGEFSAILSRQIEERG
ncbi:MAG: protein TolQ [Rhodospirillales bacterium]|nr:protein TolQ [Rhodospirillales bacterium]